MYVVFDYHLFNPLEVVRDAIISYFEESVDTFGMQLSQKAKLISHPLIHSTILYYACVPWMSQLRVENESDSTP